MKKLFSAASIIERDALRSRLENAGIASVSPARDMSRKVTNDTVDLALDGYSLFFDGFAILVEDEDFARAQSVLKEFAHEREAPVQDSNPAPHWRRFYFSAVFSMILPIVLNFVALYHLYKAVRAGEHPRPGLLIFSVLCLLPGFGLAAYIVIDHLRPIV